MFSPEKFNLGNAFKQYFEIIPAFSNALKEEVYRIRHQVYCEDLEFESIRPDRREIDEHDANSLHLLMRSVKTNEFIGCTRIIRPRSGDPYYQLPFEETCASVLDRSIINTGSLPRDKIAEISRLAVVNGYRRRKGEAHMPASISEEDFGTQGLPRFPYIPIGLYLGTTELARMNGIDTLFVLTEERLAQHFGKLGVKLQVIGGAIEHHGRRLPSMMSVTNIIRDIRSIIRPVYNSIAEDIKRNLPETGNGLPGIENEHSESRSQVTIAVNPAT
ncbi:PEP-CTERM/exosortase system-associated acyltransferase [Nitrosospira multiformis]|uniref:N-acyl amino acid synthase, PEP-CTERM/exosortase system-associated n=1 Tax=Nitrosospira multiformis TaxID=1231 RepID=A0A1I7GGR7_9PROT|nr:PEP-CTERM/exosortase system-associated acyltransferase [Nitrosospira multiformis]SFU47466.1 N-acyl amino acid synthase, PEP-CTERM/exosortase system-associated [Nitrosospira multiformis]